MALDRELTLMISLFKLKGERAREQERIQSDAAGELSNNKIHTDQQGHTSIRQLIAAKFRAVQYKRLIINCSSAFSLGYELDWARGDPTEHSHKRNIVIDGSEKVY